MASRDASRNRSREDLNLDPNPHARAPWRSASCLRRTSLIAIVAAATGLLSVTFAWAQPAAPGGSATYTPAPGSTESAPAGTGKVTIDWNAACPKTPSNNPAAQNYWDVESVALHQNGSQANYESTAEANVEGSSGTHVLVLTMGAGLQSETFSVVVHLVCKGQNMVISMSTLTLVRGTSTGSAGGGADCVVPNIVGETLARAKKLLTRAHCELGKVTAPKAGRGAKLRVRSSSPKAGTRLRGGAEVGVKLRKS